MLRFVLEAFDELREASPPLAWLVLFFIFMFLPVFVVLFVRKCQRGLKSDDPRVSVATRRLLYRVPLLITGGFLIGWLMSN
jgi:hypothetical protein